MNKIGNVTLLGEVPSFNNFVNYSAFMLISDSEGLPISAIEAMSAGLPLILSNVGGCPELINANGVLVDNTVDDIVKALFQVEISQTEMSAKSLQLYNQHYNLNNNIDKYIETYSNLINSN
jgi:glycosyltransferase involved in cell wall biosynthesis